MTDILRLSTDERLLDFYEVGLNFYEDFQSIPFSHKNNKTLGETLTHKRYAHLSDEISKAYAQSLNIKLGEFLYRLKSENDPFYLKFLNKYGDQVYCRFSIDAYLNLKGLYSYVVSGNVKYIGRCKDTFKKRINQGYGRIHPKNCFIDGQATNCHLNALINQHKDQIKFFICPLQDNMEIDRFEKELIQEMQPEWNIALKSKQI